MAKSFDISERSNRDGLFWIDRIDNKPQDVELVRHSKGDWDIYGNEVDVDLTIDELKEIIAFTEEYDKTHGV